MMRKIVDARMRGGGLDGALDAARETLAELCAREGGSPGQINVSPLIGAAYRADISWTVSGGRGGRAGKNRRQRMRAQLIPPAASDE